jgi:hypothetical protein
MSMDPWNGRRTLRIGGAPTTSDPGGRHFRVQWQPGGAPPAGGVAGLLPRTRPSPTLSGGAGSVARGLAATWSAAGDHPPTTPAI